MENERDTGQAPICRHWLRLGSCLYGEQCRFRHPTEFAAFESEGGEVAETGKAQSGTVGERRSVFARCEPPPIAMCQKLTASTRLNAAGIEGEKKRNRGPGAGATAH